MRQINIKWWIEDNNPIIYNGMFCDTHSLIQIEENKWHIIVTSPGVNDNAQFIIITNLTDLKPAIQL